MNSETLMILAGPLAGAVVALGIAAYARWAAQRDIERQRAGADVDSKA
jgi:hypothetical protein